jgi:hypothetical protein
VGEILVMDEEGKKKKKRKEERRVCRKKMKLCLPKVHHCLHSWSLSLGIYQHVMKHYQ